MRNAQGLQQHLCWERRGYAFDNGICLADACPMQPDSSPPARYASLFRNGRNQAVRIPKTSKWTETGCAFRKTGLD